MDRRGGQLADCRAETFLSGAGTPGALRRFFVVVRFRNGSGVAERCFSPRYSLGVFGNRKRREQVARIAGAIQESMRRAGHPPSPGRPDVP